MRGSDANDWPYTAASRDSEFDGFGGGVVRKGMARPKGLVHAVSPALVDQTLCGVPLVSLVLFPDLRFDRSHGRCLECGALSAGQRRR
jgi:hypothetical protein